MLPGGWPLQQSAVAMQSVCQPGMLGHSVVILDSAAAQHSHMVYCLIRLIDRIEIES